jgi:hypothetical protein
VRQRRLPTILSALTSPAPGLHARQEHLLLGVRDLEVGDVREGEGGGTDFVGVFGRVVQQRQRALARQVVGDALALARRSSSRIRVLASHELISAEENTARPRMAAETMTVSWRRKPVRRK